MIVEYMCTRTRSLVYIYQMDMGGGGGGAAAAPLILERPLKTEGWSTNIARYKLGIIFFLIVNILMKKRCCKQFQSISYYVKK